MSAHQDRLVRMDNLADQLRNASIGHPASPFADATVTLLKRDLAGHNWSRTGDVLMNLGSLLAILNVQLDEAGRGPEYRCNMLIDVMMLAGQTLYADRSS